MDAEALKHLPEDVLKEVLELTEAKTRLEIRDKAHDRFMPFVHHVYDGFIEGHHHRVIAEKLERVARGELKRLIINMPPRHSKSEFASYLMPAWFLGRNPKLKIIQATHNTELATRFGRKVRDLIDDPHYQEIFPKTLAEYFAAGVGAAVTGRGADLFIIDDPHSEQDAMSETAFDHAYEWYTSGPRQRLQPGGSIIVVMCMTGDTPVLMANGVEKPLSDIQPGDLVATYETGHLTTARINNWQSSGVDSVFKIETQSGKVLRANERHPFLVEQNGEHTWVKLKDLRPGMELVSLRAATNHPVPKQNPDFALPVKAEQATAEKTQRPHLNHSVITASGVAWNAPMLAAQARRLQKAFADLATTSLRGTRKILWQPALVALSIATESLFRTTKRWLRLGAISATYAETSRQRKIPVRIGAESSVSTTATRQVVSEGSYATTATSPSDTEQLRKDYAQLQPISNFTTDRILDIAADGEAEVFDVEVDRTGNFIANGVVSHNTRWGKKDLTGRLLANQSDDPMADQWEVVNFPAILPTDDPLWPEFWSKDALLSINKWSAQWQQQPTNAESAIVKREWWKEWEKEKIPPVKYILQAYDTAFSKKETADFSAITTWGIFDDEETGREAIILMDAQRGRWSFPELKEVAFEEHQYWEPDMVIVEKKATGGPLIDEMRKRGIPAVGFSPGRRAGGGGVDKTTRMHLVSPLFESGVVWAPTEKKFADEVIEEVASFPNGEHDDFVDSMTLALMRFRQGGLIAIEDDDSEDEEIFIPRQREYY
jgi:predicted phage terminase large subunit-like protein